MVSIKGIPLKESFGSWKEAGKKIEKMAIEWFTPSTQCKAVTAAADILLEYDSTWRGAVCEYSLNWGGNTQKGVLKKASMVRFLEDAFF